ncbi:2-oxo-4-hydroxy-4-carboxy-5-ureidoimidazoline decarboxylase [Luteimicrobium sp. DT211]|uniref:2-oxo-4-hydroxy-4-carboxy-5-ureidoimidazoline decarboxylase n=1 Tax=Luteimicrobium sp. DT211 TaxID=3393412 RepID=UPI003CF88916
MARLTAAAMRDALLPALAVRRWADDVLAGAPYDSVDALVEAATAAATPLTDAELDEALAAHPRIGERPSAEHGEAEARFSRTEQASSDAGDPALAARLAEGNRAYEGRFGRVFLIRAAGRTRAEILAELDRRLALDDDQERAVVAEQLREIMALRLRATFAADAAPVPAPPAPSLVTTHVLDTAAGRPAAGIPVRLEALVDGTWQELGSGVTDDDGRVRSFEPNAVAPGRCRLVFDTEAYLAEAVEPPDESGGGEVFFPEVTVTFVVGPDDEHLHVPLLLSPFGYSTYRGS